MSDAADDVSECVPYPLAADSVRSCAVTPHHLLLLYADALRLVSRVSKRVADPRNRPL